MIGTRCLRHYVRRFAQRQGIAQHQWYKLHEDLFIQHLDARFWTIVTGLTPGDPRETLYPLFNQRVNGVRMRPKYKSLAVTYAKLDKIMAVVDEAARRMT